MLFIIQAFIICFLTPSSSYFSVFVLLDVAHNLNDGKKIVTACWIILYGLVI